MKKVSSFQKGIFFGIGFSLVIAIFVGLGMAHSSTTPNGESIEEIGNHYGSHHKMMAGDFNNNFGCMNLCDGLSDDECIKKMDEDNDGVCDMCGMSVESCLEMKEHHRWR